MIPCVDSDAMPIDAMQLIFGLTFLGVWAIAGVIVVVRDR
jgi:hypothetical protein